MSARQGRGSRTVLTAYRRGAALVFGFIALTGCGVTGVGSQAPSAGRPSPTAAGPTTASAAAAPHAVGDCWQQDDYSTAAAWSTWQGSDAVDCTANHNTITYAMPTLGDDFVYPVDAAGNAGASVASDVVGTTACRKAMGGVLPTDLPGISRVSVLWYLPTLEQWKTGERHLRCDVSIRALDAVVSEHKVVQLPGTLAQIAATISANLPNYEACYLTATGISEGPNAEPTTTKIVSCDAPHTWQWHDRSTMTEPPGSPYPGDDAMEAAWTDACNAATSETEPAWWAAAPTAEQWEAGDRSIDCWTGAIG